MSSIWESIEALDKRITNLAKTVERVVQPSAARSRELLTVVQQEIEVDQYDLTPKYATWQNGDIDTVELWRLAMVVSKNDAPTTKPHRRVMLTRAPQGWLGTPAAASTLGVDIDVRWNYLVGSRSTRYSRDHFCNSDMLVGLDKGRALDFNVPLIVPRGEQIEFHVEPVAFALPNDSGNVTPGQTKFYVSFIGLGFRRSA